MSNDIRSQDSKILSCEYFWGLSDPGHGNGLSLNVVDGNFDEAIEEVFSNNISMPSSSGLHQFNIRAQNSAGNWGPLFKKTIYLHPFDLMILNLLAFSCRRLE